MSWEDSGHLSLAEALESPVPARMCCHQDKHLVAGQRCSFGDSHYEGVLAINPGSLLSRLQLEAARVCRPYPKPTKPHKSLEQVYGQTGCNAMPLPSARSGGPLFPPCSKHALSLLHRVYQRQSAPACLRMISPLDLRSWWEVGEGSEVPEKVLGIHLQECLAPSLPNIPAFAQACLEVHGLPKP